MGSFREKLLALLAGTLFGFGLSVSGMINPAKVLNFLDVTGDWDPTLAFVMGGAVLIGLPAFQFAKRCHHPLFDSCFHLPTRSDIDARLIGGAALFGLGWGIAGFCPGPAVAAIASLQWPVFGFLAAMVAGQWIADRLLGY